MKRCLFALLLAGCVDPVDDVASQVTISGGLYGDAQRLAGNHQPGSGHTSGTTDPATGRTVRIHQVIGLDANLEPAATDATELPSPSASGRFVVHTPIVAEGTVNESGFYQLELPPGMYSVFISDGDASYCNSYSADGLCAVDVAALSRYDIKIDYDATY